jgi:nucleotide-binding universal stress UspA family protein
MTKIVVGIDGTDRGEDAVAFARRLAEPTDAGLLLVLAYPSSDRIGRAPRFRDALRREALRVLAGVRDRVAPGAAIAAVADASPARALQTRAERRDAALIVVGSASHGRAGRIVPGTTGERLLHGAPCPVAVVPRGYAASSRAPMTRVGVGIDGGSESRVALAGATTLAEVLDAELEIIRAYAPGGLPAEALLLPDLRSAAGRELADALATVPPSVAAHPVLLLDAPLRALAWRSHELDLLVVGSRGYGPSRAVLLGGVSGRLIRRAACPVLVVPRGVELPFAALLASRPASSARTSGGAHAI